ncbi:MAG: hypothetical protein WA735_25980, partial [Candidatus Acidiferrales bacterium]
CKDSRLARLINVQIETDLPATSMPGLRQATAAAKISYLRAGKSRNPNPQSWTPFHESNSLAQQQP